MKKFAVVISNSRRVLNFLIWDQSWEYFTEYFTNIIKIRKLFQSKVSHKRADWKSQVLLTQLEGHFECGMFFYSVDARHINFHLKLHIQKCFMNSFIYTLTKMPISLSSKQTTNCCSHLAAIDARWRRHFVARLKTFSVFSSAVTIQAVAFRNSWNSNLSRWISPKMLSNNL